MSQNGWTGLPPDSEEDIESEAIHYVHSMVAWMRDVDHDRATWKVGTASNEEFMRRLAANEISYGMCGWRSGSAKRASEELAEYHGMELEGVPDERHPCIFGYTDRAPTREERRLRNKEPLTVKQKAVFRTIREHIRKHGRGPRKIDIMKAMGHRSGTTTNGYLAILARKNWILPPEGGRPIELN